ncbi:MAG TPA: hypothetical protein VFH26_00840 [Gemmatimonadales bacterium]|nr:hypothetical protein [Gemmatimonadales bacterium]
MVSSQLRTLSLAAGLLSAVACARSTSSSSDEGPSPRGDMSAEAPKPDPRVGLRAGRMDAAEAIWNLQLVSKTPPSEQFVGQTNSDLAFIGNHVIQGSYNGWQVWDISNPRQPSLKTAYVCPASQSDVSVYKNLLFVSGENLSARLDCGTQGVEDTVSSERLRGIRIFDISDITKPRNVGNVQTCRGSHTHTVLVDPKDSENVYVYISGSSHVRPESELPGCIRAPKDPNSALFRIEVIKVPLANPSQAAIVNSPRIFQNLVAPPRHGEAPEDIAARKKQLDEAKAAGLFTATIDGEEEIIPPQVSAAMLDSVVAARGGTGAPTAADSATLRQRLPAMIEAMEQAHAAEMPDSTAGPTQCHDITVYPAIGLAGGACEGYGFLIDIKDPVRPNRIGAVSDSNFSYWHSATFNNSGSKILFSDEWGGGSQAKCRASDKPEWGADAIFTISKDRKMEFQGYYKLPAPQTAAENCVAHNGSLIPIPGRDIMAQAWYQGGISVFDWTNPKRPKEIAFFDRGPIDPTRIESGGYWSTYWYNGYLVGSEMARGLDIFELTPSAFISENEIAAAKTVKFDYLNTQGQQKFVWPASVSLARAYLDQLERSNGLEAGKIAEVRAALATAEKASASERRVVLSRVVSQLEAETARGSDTAKVNMLASTVRELAGESRLAARR